jgi:hypothetical protein
MNLQTVNNFYNLQEGSSTYRSAFYRFYGGHSMVACLRNAVLKTRDFVSKVVFDANRHFLLRNIYTRNVTYPSLVAQDPL